METTRNSWNVAAALCEQARSQPGAAAIHYPTGVRDGKVRYQSVSYSELDQLSDHYAHGLQEAGITRGMRTALMVPPGPEFFALFFAFFKAGIVPVLIDPGIGLKPLKHCLAEAAPEAFVGITKAQLARVILRWAPQSIRTTVTLGPRLGWGGWSAKKLLQAGEKNSEPALCEVDADDMAAILFTSGSTGIPKGVVYRHRHFVSQVDMLRTAFDIRPGEVDLATFPPFALFDPALGMTTVVPHMDPTRPAEANPNYLMQAIDRFAVTNIFGSPALLKVLGKHTHTHNLKLPTVKRVLSAGAAVPIDTIRTLEAALESGASVNTPYGATECLPVATISNRDLDEDVALATRAGHGTCVGFPVSPNRVEIIDVSDDAISSIDEDDFLGSDSLGEIVVSGPTATDQYWNRDEQTRLAKFTGPDGNTWHRMGDVGYRDTLGRLWFCGRKSQRVRLAHRDLFPDQVEAVFNAIPGIERTALVGVGEQPQTPVLCIEREAGGKSSESDLREVVLNLAGQHPHLRELEKVLFHPAFPVDIRHNSKIGREQLARWAAEQLR